MIKMKEEDNTINDWKNKCVAVKIGTILMFKLV